MTTIHVRLGGILRSSRPLAHGRLSLGFPLEDSPTVEDVLTRLSVHPSAVCLIAINGVPEVDLHTPLHDGDTVSLLPTLAGGSARLGPFVVTDQPLDLLGMQSAVADPRAGAIVTFMGTVRDHSRGRQIHHLEYEAYSEMAIRVMQEIAQDMSHRWDLCAIAIAHRTGPLAIGEASIIIAVSSPHRAEAFAACAYCIDRIKEILPVWKKEYAEDGATWIEGPGEYGRGSIVER
jgi:molybdopterin synthase catalytic subunit